VPHPSTRLALATLVAGVFLVLAQTTITFARLPELSGQRARIAQMENDPAFIRWDYARQAPLEIPLHPDEVFAGAPDAPNTIVSFSDFLCRHCRRTHEIFPELLKRHPELRIAFRHYPLDAQCSANPALQIGGHAGACQAARAVEAARQLGGRDKYLALRGLLWKRQDELAAAGQRAAAAPPVRDFLIAAAAELGLDRDAFAEALDSAAVSARVQADVQTADRLGVSELPAVFLNGRRVRNWGRAETYDVLLAGRESQPAASQP
jgi:protein-disulfide isomerase